jgi:hypothetical protein
MSIPGRDKYDSGPEHFRRVAVLTWMVTVAIAHLIVTSLLNDANTPRKELLETVMKEFNLKYRELSEEMENAKAKLSRTWYSARHGEVPVKAQFWEWSYQDKEGKAGRNPTPEWSFWEWSFHDQEEKEGLISAPKWSRRERGKTIRKHWSFGEWNSSQGGRDSETKEKRTS